MSSFEETVKYLVGITVHNIILHFHGFGHLIPRKQFWYKIYEYECTSSFEQNAIKYTKGDIYEFQISPDQLMYSFDCDNFKLLNEYVKVGN